MRILALTHRLPYAPDRGDRLRAYHILKYLNRRALVELISLVHDEAEAGHAHEMQELAVAVTTARVPRIRNYVRGVVGLSGSIPLTHILLDAPGLRRSITEVVTERRPDVVFAYGSGMAPLALQGLLKDIPLVIDFVDMDSQKWRELAQKARPPMSWVYRREAKHLSAFEARAATIARASLVVNSKEASVAKALSPSAHIHTIHNGVDLERLRPTAEPSARPQVVFCGVMNYEPNHQGMMWFAREVWPLVRSRIPAATLAIVGSDPQRALVDLAANESSITVTGRVPDVRPWLWESAVAIAPLHVARGIQNKALEAIGAGLPIVVTPAVAEGLPSEATSAMSIADTAEQFASHVVALLSRTGEERRRIAASGDLSSQTWSRTLEPLWPIFESAASMVY